MRIISGKFKGKKISYINSTTTRPLRDYVKENIFNIIVHGKDKKFELDKKNVLDLYSGIGSFGIECLSRNASKVVFIERNQLAFSILKKNVSDLNMSSKAKLVFEDIENYLKTLNGQEKFDIIFLDPPFKDITYLEIIDLIKKKRIFNKEKIVIIHREKKYEEDLQKVLKVKQLKSYGRSQIIFGSF